MDGVTIVTDDVGLPSQTQDGWIRGSALSGNDQFLRDFYVKNLGEVVGAYPPELLRKVGLKRIVVCDHLSFDESECNAFADVARGILYVSVKPGLNATYLRRTAHHEIFHQIDFAEDRKLDADPGWEALNAPGFRYAGNAHQLQADPSATTLDEGVEGFLNKYSTSSPAEDKAELYSYLVTDRENVRRRERRDSVLRQKIVRIRQAVDHFGAYSQSLFMPE